MHGTRRFVNNAYVRSPALLTDLYQLTMAHGYWKHGIAERKASFHLTFRRNPFGSGFTLACGLAPALEFLRGFRFSDDDLGYLARLEAPDGSPLLAAGFLDHLATLRLTCDVFAVPEGTVVYPHEPLVRVEGPLLQAQVLETGLLNLINFQTLIATKAARVCHAARGDPVLEFGLRRAQGVDGGLAASRAAFVGGCVATSNLLAGRSYGIPVRGTHAHSWVMAFDDEAASFDAYAEAMPNNVVLLVDTHDTLAGVDKAIATGRKLRARGGELRGVRIDSGDLLALSRRVRRRLDEAGFAQTRIIATSDLDEHRIAALKEGGAPIDTWGVGTRLATAYDEPALGGVYKLSALRGEDGWDPKVKRSGDDPAKASNPGRLQVRRYAGERDVIYDVDLRGPVDGTDLLVEVMRGGDPTYDPPALEAVRARAGAQLAALPDAVRRLQDPGPYPVVLEPRLAARKAELMARSQA
ncbi:MAG: nicotinate phosphoribosyltransferase [Planctomycetota bacterium]|jgi:nicotinate phosphoribosyltransferase